MCTIFLLDSLRNYKIRSNQFHIYLLELGPYKGAQRIPISAAYTRLSFLNGTRYPYIFRSSPQSIFRVHLAARGPVKKKKKNSHRQHFKLFFGTTVSSASGTCDHCRRGIRLAVDTVLQSTPFPQSNSPLRHIRLCDISKSRNPADSPFLFFMFYANDMGLFLLWELALAKFLLIS